MNYQEWRPTPSQTRSTRTLGFVIVAMFLIVAVVAALLSPFKDLPSIYLSMIVSICVLGGVIGLYVAAARLLDLWLPDSLRMTEKGRDQTWRLLALSLIAILFPLIVLMVEHDLSLMIQHSIFH
jgi:hypothetical protein